MSAPPLPMVYDGDGRFHVLPHARALATEHYGQGEVVKLAPVEEPSQKSRGHYFAVLHECWQNLPEAQTGRWLNEEHFRKHGLIATGNRDERSVVCASKAEAERVAAFIRPMDEYAVIVASEAVVTVYTAKSQSLKAMGKAAFQKSKEDVLAWAAEQAGVTVQAAADNARRAA